MSKKTNGETKSLRVNGSTVIGSQYAQLVVVTVGDIDVTIDFIYKHPRNDVEEGQVVARVTLPHSVAKQLPKIIDDTIAQHDTNKKTS